MVRLRQKAAAWRGTVVALAAGALGVALLGDAPAATPVFASASSAATSTSAQTLTIPRPAGVEERRVLVAAVAVRVGSPTAVSAPGGWTDVVRTTCTGDNADLTQAIFVKVASSAEPAEYTFSVTTATGAVGSILAYSGVDAVQPVDASGGRIARNARWILAPSVTTSSPQALLVGAFAHSARVGISTPAGMTARADSTTGGSAPNTRMLAADQLLAGVGPTGERGAQADARVACAVGQLVALRAAPDPPSSTSPPVLSGVAEESAVLSAATGSWSGSPTSFAYRWQRSSDSGQTWLDIAGATSAAYAVGTADVGSTIRVVVTASNSGGSGSAPSGPSAAVLPAAPANVSPPTISGTARVHETITASAGSWSGAPTSYAFTWERCDGAGASCAAIPGADGATYVLTAADVGFTVRVVVRASNAGGSGTAASSGTAAVEPASPPGSIELPTISGLPQDGRTLTATTGTWSDSPAGYAFQWQHCDQDGGDCSPIAGAVGGTRELTGSDVGFSIRVLVTASNAAGSTDAASLATSVVLPAGPVNLSPPTVSGEPVEGGTLVASTGDWSGASTSYDIQWERCDTAGAACSAVPGATGSTHSLGAADVGFTIRVVVTAANAGGTTSAPSQATAVVLPTPPVNVSPPTISGTVRESEVLSADTGSWSGSVTGYAHAWQRSSDGGQTWSDIAGADSTGYVPTAADIGFLLRVVVTASNLGGSASATSSTTVAVAPAVAPTAIDLPAILGTAQEGVALTATTGSWTGSPSAFGYQWQRSADDGQSWADIAGAAAVDYTPVAAEVGMRLRVSVSATNPGGTTTASSEPTAPVLPAPPTSTSPPIVTGAPVEGGTLRASTGDWSGEPTSHDFQWERCIPGGACSEIRWGNVDDYTLKDDDVGFTVRVVVTASNAGGPATAASEPTAVVLPLPPVNEELPTISGVAEEGEVLTASPGTWQSSGPATYAHAWQRSSDGGQTWIDLTGEDGTTYAITSADVGSALRAVVTASNAGGSAAAFSDATAVVAPPGGPIAVVPPTIWGYVQTGRMMTATTGTWSGSPTGYAYRWQRSGDGGATWTDIPGAAAYRYTMTAADVGLRVRALVTASNGIGSNTAATNAATAYPAGNLVALVNRTWYCDFPVNLDLVKVTITDNFNRDAVRFDECTGRIGRVEIDTNGADGLKVRNVLPVAQDLEIEGGYVRCSSYPEGAHQDAIQALGGQRVTFRNLFLACQGNANLFIARGASGATTPTDIVCENCVLGPTSANPALISTSIRSGMRNSLTCQSPVWGHAIEYRADAQQAVGVTSVPVVIFAPTDPDVGLLTDGNEVVLASDPRCYGEPIP